LSTSPDGDGSRKRPDPGPFSGPLPRPAGTLRFLVEAAAFFVIFRAATHHLSALPGPWCPVASAILALLMPAGMRLLAGGSWKVTAGGDAGDASGTPTSGPPGPLPRLPVSSGPARPPHGRRDLLLAAWTGTLLLAAGAAIQLVAGALAPDLLHDVLRRSTRLLDGGPLLRLGPVPATAVAAALAVWTDTFVEQGYLQEVGMHRFGPAGAASAWLLSGWARAGTLYLAGFGAPASLLAGMVALAPGPLAQALFRHGGLLPVLAARTVAALLPVAQVVAASRGADVRLPSAVLLGAASFLLVPLTLRAGEDVRLLLREAAAIVRRGLPLGLALAAGLLSAQLPALVGAGTVAAVMAAGVLILLRLVGGTGS
jgi:hypothetical protein